MVEREAIRSTQEGEEALGPNVSMAVVAAVQGLWAEIGIIVVLLVWEAMGEQEFGWIFQGYKQRMVAAVAAEDSSVHP
jgi:hypothetical protein